jgi:hypothetical protein
MTDKDQKKQDDNKNTIDSVVTGVAEEVAIVGDAVAATMAIENKKNTKK